jgi:transcriptional regulator with XRE-family HTH domain
MIRNTDGFDLGIQIRKYRMLVGLSQKDLAVKLGVSSVRLNNWEHNRHSPSIEYLAKICIILKISPDDLLDIHYEQDKLTSKEKAVIQSYRGKSNLQDAIDKLLEIDE